MADKLGISENEIEGLLNELRNKEQVGNDAECGNYIGELEDQILRYEEDIAKGVAELVFNCQEEIKTLDELIIKCRIDTEKWEITKYVQNYWGNKQNPHWQVKAWLGKKTAEQVFQDSFTTFLEEYVPIAQKVISPKVSFDKEFASLIINKQDSHLNKFDIDGNNNIPERLSQIMYKMEIILEQASLSNNLDNITYIIGSDEFNSEFTGATTKGTPQTNTHTYHTSFEYICNHEILMITLLLQYSNNLNVVYVSGNHDEYAGWHLVTWLQAYFKNESKVTFDVSPKYRKYISYGNSAMMFNHGDAIKPAKLAAMFPIEYRENWSDHENFYIFTGDKHHEVSQDFNGIKFYQLPAISNAKGLWEDKHGHVGARAEITGFLIEKEGGLTNIFKQSL
jgi:hypothetical protein